MSVYPLYSPAGRVRKSLRENIEGSYNLARRKGAQLSYERLRMEQRSPYCLQLSVTTLDSPKAIKAKAVSKQPPQAKAKKKIAPIHLCNVLKMSLWKTKTFLLRGKHFR